MKNKALVLAFAAAAVVCLGVPAMAGTFTSSDGSFSVELPNDSWTTFENSNNWISLSDGSSVLTIDHFTNGDVLPAPITTVDPYVETFQTVFSNKNDIYLFTGSVADEAKLKDITGIILSANVMKLNTAPAIAGKDSTAPAAAPTGTPAPNAETAAKETGTRTVYDENGKAITLYPRSDGLWRDNEGNAYIRISSTVFQAYEGTKQLFTYNRTEITNDYNPNDNKNAQDIPGSAVIVYDEMGESFTLYERMDGFWHDSQGTLYRWVSGTEFKAYEGNKHVFTYDISKTNDGLVPEEYYDYDGYDPDADIYDYDDDDDYDYYDDVDDYDYYDDVDVYDD